MTPTDTKNKDGFDSGASIDIKDLLKYEAEQRQKEKSSPKPLPQNHALSVVISNILMSQKVRLKPLALEVLTTAVVDYHKKPKQQPKKV